MTPPGTGGGDGEILRPDATVLPDEALVPAANLVVPAPTRFTHVLVRDEPYRYGADPAAAPDGALPSGAPVVLVATSGDDATVVDERGLSVHVRRDSLRPLPPS